MPEDQSSTLSFSDKVCENILRKKWFVLRRQRGRVVSASDSQSGGPGLVPG